MKGSGWVWDSRENPVQLDNAASVNIWYNGNSNIMDVIFRVLEVT